MFVSYVIAVTLRNWVNDFQTGYCSYFSTTLFPNKADFLIWIFFIIELDERLAVRNV